MSLKIFSETMHPAIETELKRQIARLDEPHTRPFYDMLTYHMGWTGEGAGPEASGKRIRPLMVLLIVAACNTEWLHAISGAAAVELVHNFSLVHDDIQDNSGKRRGRKTTWKIWGMPMAINVGDALFVLSNQAAMDLSKHYPAPTVLKAATVLHNTCLDLTRGQFLDMSYEKRNDLGVEDYWPMIAGKTAALLSACCHIGAILGQPLHLALEDSLPGLVLQATLATAGAAQTQTVAQGTEPPQPAADKLSQPSSPDVAHVGIRDRYAIRMRTVELNKIVFAIFDFGRY